MVASGGLIYQWFGPDRNPLSDVSGEITGTSTPTLQILNVQSDDVGSYRVRVTNAGGSVVSDTVVLRIGKLCLNCVPV